MSDKSLEILRGYQSEIVANLRAEHEEVVNALRKEYEEQLAEEKEATRNGKWRMDLIDAD